MVESNRKSPTYARSRLRDGCAAFVCLFLSGMFLGCTTPDGAVDRGRVGRSPRPIDMDPEFAEKLGREALAKIGYLPIINLARQAGWVTTKAVRRPIGGDRSFISMDVAQIATANEFIEVYSKYAVIAGVTSQMDSPIPGPFDVVAVGVLVLGLIDAGILAGALLQALDEVVTVATASTTTEPPPVTRPDQEPKPEGEPKTTGTTSPPTDRPPEEKKETCEAARPDIIRCDDPDIRYRLPGENAAFKEIVRRLGKGVRKAKVRDAAREGPCIGRGGFHTNVLDGGRSAASIVGCDCCDDSSGKAVKQQRADIIYKR